MSEGVRPDLRDRGRETTLVTSSRPETRDSLPDGDGDDAN